MMPHRAFRIPKLPSHQVFRALSRSRGAAVAFLLGAALALASGAPAQAAGHAAKPAKRAVIGRHSALESGLAVTPKTGEGCHQYDWWDGYDICIMVWGSGLNVQEVEGWVDGRDGAADYTRLYTADGDLNTSEDLNSAGQSWFDWSIGGGIWLANYQNICFQDVTINQTACLYLNVS